jgi:hypothetical protein
VAAQDPVNIVNFVNFGLSAGAAWGSTNDMRPIDALKDGLMPLAMLEQHRQADCGAASHGRLNIRRSWTLSRTINGLCSPSLTGGRDGH